MDDILLLHITTPTFESKRNCSHLAPIELLSSANSWPVFVIFFPFAAYSKQAHWHANYCLHRCDTIHICDELDWIFEQFRTKAISSPYGFTLVLCFSYDFFEKFWPLAFECHQCLREMFFKHSLHLYGTCWNKWCQLSAWNGQRQSFTYCLLAGNFICFCHLLFFIRSHCKRITHGPPFCSVIIYALNFLSEVHLHGA